MSATVVEAPIVQQLCSYRGCLKQCQTQCAATNCEKWICINCYESRVLQKYDLCALPCPDDIETVACTKRCYQTALKYLSGKGRRTWDTDTPRGSYEDSSEAMLIDWMLVHGNYERWRGNNSGITKRQIQQGIADRLNKRGEELKVYRGRTEEQVGSKIAYMESKYRSTKNWIENTGQGVRATLGEESFRENVIDRFKHFYTLQPIMADRACMGSTNFTDQYDARGRRPPQTITIQENANLVATRNENNANKHTSTRDISFLPILDPLQDVENTNNGRSLDDDNSETLETTDQEEDGSVRSSAVRLAIVRDQMEQPSSTPALPKTARPRTPQDTIENIVSKINDKWERDRNQVQKQSEQASEKASQQASIQCKEQMRHNREMENIEKLKVGIMAKKARTATYDNIERTMQLFRSSKLFYDDFKDTMTLEDMAEAMPSCIKCFNLRSMSEADRNNYIQTYNDWAILNELTDRINPAKYSTPSPQYDHIHDKYI